MANESFVSVPPNLDDPTVLRRFLSRLVEQVDVAFGNRAGQGSTYVNQEALTDIATSLEASITEAKELLEQVVDTTENDVTDAIDAIDKKLNTLTSTVSKLMDYAAIKGAILRFTVDGSNNVIHSTTYNIDETASARISVGVYRFKVEQTTFFGDDVVTNSTLSSEHLIAAAASSELFDVEIKDTGTAGEFDVHVSSFVVGGGSVLTKQPYDLLPDDVVDITAIFNKQNSELPPV